MSLAFRMRLVSAAWAALADRNRLSWHTSVSSLSVRMLALYASQPLDRKSPKPGSKTFTRPKSLYESTACADFCLSPGRALEGDGPRADVARSTGRGSRALG